MRASFDLSRSISLSLSSNPIFASASTPAHISSALYLNSFSALSSALLFLSDASYGVNLVSKRRGIWGSWGVFHLDTEDVSSIILRVPPWDGRNLRIKLFALSSFFSISAIVILSFSCLMRILDIPSFVIDFKSFSSDRITSIVPVHCSTELFKAMFSLCRWHYLWIKQTSEVMQNKKGKSYLTLVSRLPVKISSRCCFARSLSSTQ